jgi:hypothetical protein
MRIRMGRDARAHDRDARIHWARCARPRSGRPSESSRRACRRTPWRPGCPALRDRMVPPARPNAPDARPRSFGARTNAVDVQMNEAAARACAPDPDMPRRDAGAAASRTPAP